jgi:hypothetical protein
MAAEQHDGDSADVVTGKAWQSSAGPYDGRGGKPLGVETAAFARRFFVSECHPGPFVVALIRINSAKDLLDDRLPR